MSRATARWDASKCNAVTETPVLNTFAWVACVHPRGVLPPLNFSSLYRQQAAGVHGGGWGWASGVCAERSVSRSHLFLPAVSPYTRLCSPRAQRRSVLSHGLWALGIAGGEKWVEGGGVERMELMGARQGWVVSGAFSGGRWERGLLHVQRVVKRTRWSRRSRLWPPLAPAHNACYFEKLSRWSVTLDVQNVHALDLGFWLLLNS